MSVMPIHQRLPACKPCRVAYVVIFTWTFLPCLSVQLMFDLDSCWLTYDTFNCSNNRMDTLPPIPVHVKTALFSNCGLYGVEPNVGTLGTLDLSINRLTTVALDSYTLRFLNVSSNSLLSDLALNASALIDLDASYCSINYLKEDFFARLNSLRTLRIAGNPLKTLASNNLHELYTSDTLVKELPRMPRLIYLDASTNKFLTVLKTDERLRLLKASDCSLVRIDLNKGLKFADLSKNQISSLAVDEALEFLNASWNILRTMEVNNQFLSVVDLSNNLLSQVHVESSVLTFLDLARNPIHDLKVHCTDCIVNCSFCQVRKVDVNNVRFLDLSWNSLDRIDLQGVHEVDLTHNALTEVVTSAVMFDVRYNALSTPKNLRVEGVGFLANNTWTCDCVTLKELRSSSRDERICSDDRITWDKCFGRRSAAFSWIPLTISLVIALVFFLLIFYLKCRVDEESVVGFNDPRSHVVDVEDPRDALPSYEEALNMAKPNWRRAREGARRYRRDQNLD